jgi:hypothetical protein
MLLTQLSPFGKNGQAMAKEQQDTSQETSFCLASSFFSYFKKPNKIFCWWRSERVDLDREEFDSIFWVLTFLVV